MKKGLYIFLLGMLGSAWAPLGILSAQTTVTHPFPHPLRLGEYTFSGLQSNSSTEWPLSMIGWEGNHIWVTPEGTPPTTYQSLRDGEIVPNTGLAGSLTYRNEGSLGISTRVRANANDTNPTALVIALDTRGRNNINITYTLEPINVYVDGGTSGFIMQYRLAKSGNWTNISASRFSYLADGGAALYYEYSFALPAACNNQPLVQIRWLHFTEVDPAARNFSNRYAIHTLSISGSAIAPTAKPKARFFATDTIIIKGSSITFIDSSTNAPTNYRWDFGDSTGTSASNEPKHKYDTAGKFNVQLIAGNSLGQDTARREQYIWVVDTSGMVKPVPEYIWSASGLKVDFTDQSTASPLRWTWNFGDGSPVVKNQNPSHTYAAYGSYDVKLIVWNFKGIDSITKTVIISEPLMAPEAEFDYVIDGLNVSFEDLSTNAPTTWKWNFGDGTGTSVVQNPSFTYTTAGTYSVQLIATNAIGSDTATKEITVSETVLPPTALFTYTQIEMEIKFKDQSSNNPTSWKWDFGDGTPNGTQKNPTHLYAAPGNYTVCLMVSNSAGADTSCQELQIIAGIWNRVFSNLTLIPNPSSGTVYLSGYPGGMLGSVRVVNHRGQVVMEGNIEAGNSLSLDLSGYAPGLYHIVLRSGEQLYRGSLLLE